MRKALKEHVAYKRKPDPTCIVYIQRTNKQQVPSTVTHTHTHRETSK